MTGDATAAAAIDAALAALGKDQWLRMAILTQDNVEVIKRAARTAVEAAAPVLLAEHERQIREKVARDIEDSRDEARRYGAAPRSLRTYNRCAAIARGSGPAGQRGGA